MKAPDRYVPTGMISGDCGYYQIRHSLGIVAHAAVELYDVVADKPDEVGEVRGSRLITNVT